MILKILFLTFSLLNLSFANIKEDEDVLSKVISHYMHESNDAEIKNITKKFLDNHTGISYLTIKNLMVNKVTVSFYQKESGEVIEGEIPKENFEQECEIINTTINYENKIIGEIDICLNKIKVPTTFTKEELLWIKENRTIKVHNEYNWAPFNYNLNNTPLGYSIDYIELLAKKANLNVKFIQGTWNELLNKAFDKKIDVMMNIAKTSEREKKLLYVGVYAKNVTSILTKNTRDDITNMESLFGKKVSVVKGFFYENFIKENYPKIKIVTYNNTLDSLKAVVYDEVDATLGKTVILNHLISENIIKGLKYTSDVKTDNPDIENMYIAVRNNSPTLQSILKKAMAEITIEEIDYLRLKWFKDQRRVKFSKEEYSWLNKHPVIKYSEVNWKPLSIINKNAMTGIMGDYLNLIEKSSGIKFEYIPSSSWPEVLEKFKKGEIDLVPGIGNTEEETKLGSVSKEYANFPMVIVTNDNIEFVSSLKKVENKVFSLPKYYSSYNHIKKQYPKAKILETTNIFDALLNVSNGDADIFVGHIAPAIYYMKKIGKDNLKITGEMNIKFHHHFLINPKYKEFISITNKVFRSITEKEREKIYNSWVQTKIEQNKGFTLKKVLSYIIPIILIIIILISIIIYWNRKLKSLVDKKTSDISNQKEELQNILNSFDKNVIFLQTNLKGVIVHPSKSFCKISGYSKKELIGKSSNIIRHSDTPKETFQILWNNIEKNELWEGELKNKKKDGTSYWLHSKIEPEFNNKNEKIGYKAISQDITDKKIVEDLSKNLEKKVEERTLEVFEQRRFMQTLLDSLEQIVITSNGKTLKSINKKFLEFFKINDVDDFLNSNNCISDKFEQIDSELYLKKSMNGQNWIEYILENKDKYHKAMINNGTEYKIFSVTAATLPIENGKIKSVVFTDITEVEEIRKDIEMILSNIMSPVIISSKKNRTILYANEYAAKQYEISVNDLIGKPIDMVYKTLNQKDEVNLLINTKGSVENLEQKYKTGTGKEFIGLLSVKPIHYNNEDALIKMIVDITKQKDIEEEIRLVNKQTKDSIEYASLIQHSLIPSNELFKKYFSDYLTIWEPKDIVGGDIYLLEELRNENECLIMVVDCTGHGVPGAFVTMLVKAIERQITSNIINSNEIVSPSKILGIFNKSMKHLLKQENKDSISNAGFDGAIFYYNKEKNIVKFSGSETPLIYLHKGELEFIKGDRHSIGYKNSDRDFKFKEHTINVEKGMQFYISTDGYIDQNGGTKGFPFGKKRFMNIIKENSKLTFKNQEKVLLDELSLYQGEEEKNDDITIIGVKI